MGAAGIGERSRPAFATDAALALAVLVLSVVIFLLFLRPPALSDQLNYFYTGFNIDQARASHQQLRIGLILPVWAVSRVFGYSELSYYFMPMLGALSLSLGTFFLGRLLFGRWVGFFAGILVIFNPQVLRNLTHLLPDYVAAGLFTLALVLVIWLGQRGALQRPRLSGGTMALLFAAGLLVGWSYLAREYVVVLFPVIPLTALALRARFLPTLVPLGFGALLCWLGELAWGWARFDNPLVRLLAVSSPRQTERAVTLDPWDIIMQLPDLFLRDDGGWYLAALLGLGLAGSVAMAAAGDRRWQAIAAWLAFGWLFFTLVALLPILALGEDRVYLRMHKFRYWALILPPIIVAGLAVLQLVARTAARLAPRRLQPGAIAALTALLSVGVAWSSLHAVASISGSSAFVRNGASGYHEFRDLVRELDGDYEAILLNREVAWVASTRSLPIYLNEWHGLSRAWTGDVIEYRFSELDSLLERGNKRLLAIDRTRMPFVLARAEPPEAFLHPERFGRELYRSESDRIVVVDVSRTAGRADRSRHGRPRARHADGALRFRGGGI